MEKLIFYTVLDTSTTVRISPILTDRSCIKRILIRTSNSDLSNCSMVSTIMVFKTITNVCENSSASEGCRTFIKSEQENASITRKRKLATSEIDGFQKKLSAEENSEESTALITNARRTGTLFTNRPGVSGVDGALRDKLIPLKLF